MPQEFDTIVLGLGGIGSGAAYWLARRGQRVLGLEQFEFDHVRGESHDHARIIRLSYVTPEYVHLAKEAYVAWDAVEADTGTTIVTKTGGLDLGPRNGAIPLDGYARSMRACGVPFDELDAAEIRRRYPAFTIDDNVSGLFQADAGVVAAAGGAAAHLQGARQHGAVLCANAPVTSIRNVDGEIAVDAGGKRYRAAHLIIAAGPWTPKALAWFDTRLPLEVTKEQVTYFVPGDPAQFEVGRWPVWIWMDDPSFYGLPIFGEQAVKIAQDAGGKVVDPDTRDFARDPAIDARINAFLARYLPSVRGRELLTKTCLYTLTPDRDFVIDVLPEHPNVSVAVGAGHAYKFASVIGRILSDFAIDGSTASVIPSFAIDRPILQLESPPKSYMV